MSESRRTLPKRVIQEVRARLDEGRALPDDLKGLLFESKREYELSYASKKREADVLAETMAVPLQATKTFGSEGETGWRNMLILGDNLQVLRTLLDMKERGQILTANGLPGVRLCYIDPPFASRQEFTGGGDERAYQDRVIGAEFIEYLRRRLILIRELLSEDGSLFVHMDQRKVHYIKVVLDELFGESNFRNEIIVKRPISKNLQQQFAKITKLPRGHDTLLWYSKRSSARFPAPETPTAVQRPEGYWHRFWSGADRPTMRYPLLGVQISRGQWKWEKERALRAVGNYKRFLKEAGGRTLVEYWMETGQDLEFIRLSGTGEPESWYPPSDTQLADTLWTFLRAYPNKKVYPTQKHTELLEYIIETGTDPGDVVLDAFCGSGTTLVAAEQLPKPRCWIGIDCGKLAIYTTQERLLQLGADKRTLLSTRPFTVFNAGLYDFRLLKKLPWAEFRSFALQLFQCRDEPHSVGRVDLDGYRGLDHVLVFDFQDHPGSVLNESFIDDLHEAIGERIGRRFFVIAPAASVRFLQDYLERDTKEYPVRYFVLRIPYSIIDELHTQPFSSLLQPSSESAVNDIVEAVGFDFIQPPRVSCAYTRTAKELRVKIRDFESEALVRGESYPAGLDALAMVMVDADYDGTVFDLDEVLYARDLQGSDYQFSIPAAEAGNQVMLIYIDRFGNEHREVKKLVDFRGGRRS